MLRKLVGASLLTVAIVVAGAIIDSAIGLGHSSAAVSTQPQAAQPSTPLRFLRHGFRMRLGELGMPTVGGTVTDVKGTTISLKTHQGTSASVTVGSGTVYDMPGGNASLSDIHIGSEIVVIGKSTGTNSYSADRILTIPDHAAGKVTGINGASITIAPLAGPFGESSKVMTIVTDGNTKYGSPRDTSAGFSSIKVGSFVLAIGTLNAVGTTLTAKHVMIAPAGFTREGGMHAGSPPVGGPGDMPPDNAPPVSSGVPSV